MPIFRRPTDMRDRPNGFTLIEMLVVLAIISLVAVILGVNVGKRPAGLANARVIAALGSAAGDARRRAMTRGSVVTLDFEPIVLGASVTPLVAPYQQAPQQGATTIVTFYPDGTSSGARLMTDGREIAQIGWLDSAVTVAR